ncbi:helix-turn-helix domain-containing protein [Streptomyces kronopolitis]|uniref:helix-turn-helix domain-containing protein n=1 Tax=Streptomyces kronopolitis TaxID=1612435 RepID=UPI0020BD742F|nr:helix-turn-helix transcriptional regulator [Streptomyces kronopolitis]MCL6302934.1 helix-turn-helix domain-containing protein [Streptomyces kronopolitis]
MEQESDWAERLAATIAGEILRYRRNQKMSAQRLSDRCAELGMDVPRATISNLENGRRTSIAVAELLVLAAALDVPPAALVFPVGYTEETEALPGAMTPPYEAVRWFGGEEHSATPQAAAQDPTSPLRHLSWRTEGAAGEALTGYRRAERIAEIGLKHADRADHMRADAYDLEEKTARDALVQAAQKQDDKARTEFTNLTRELDTLHDLGATVTPNTLHVGLFRQVHRGTQPREAETKGTE